MPTPTSRVRVSCCPQEGRPECPATPRGTGSSRVLRALPLTTLSRPFTPALNTDDKLTLLTTDSGPFPRELAFTGDEKEGNGRGMKRRGIDRVCCEQTPSRHGEGGTQPHRSAWAASALAWELPSRQQLQAAAGRSRRRAARVWTGSEPRTVVLETRQATPGTGLSAPILRPGQGAAPGEMRDTRPGLPRSH